MLLLHKGVDALDLSFPLTIGADLSEEFEKMKACMAENRLDSATKFGSDYVMLVFPNGAKGGFAYRCRIGRDGHDWLFKKPGNGRDEWGARVSCRAQDLALHGVDGVRAELDTQFGIFGLHYTPGIESLARIDFAMDFLAPDLVLDPARFVMHGRSTRKTFRTHGNKPVESVEHGRSGRVTSVTIGRNPNRQVIVYDKREEIFGKPSGLPVIWNDRLEQAGYEPLNLRDARVSRVWRVEVRFYKDYLKKQWQVTTFADLRAAMLPMLRDTVGSIRYTAPNGDSNRARWPDHRLWERVREEIECDFMALASPVDPLTVSALSRAQQAEYLDRQIKGCVLNLAALKGISQTGLDAFTGGYARIIARGFAADPERTRKKMQAARARYGVAGE